MNSDSTMEVIANQPSFQLSTEVTEAFITERGAMMAPVTFHRTTQPVQPYSIAPWAEETLDEDTPSIIRTLRGDFMCSAFGGNDEPFEGKPLPLHGDTANARWTRLRQFETQCGCGLDLETDMPLQGGKCRCQTALLHGRNMVYQRHDFSGVDGPINPGHHAMIRFPDPPGSGRLSFSPFIHAHTFIEPTEKPEQKGYSWLKPDTEVDDLSAVPCIDGSTADVTSFPARRGFEDIMIVCTDPTLDFAWSAVTFPEEGQVWFSLRDPSQFSSTLLWFSNGGRHYAPWSGRHVNVVGIEDMNGFFHLGLAPSARHNFLNEKGVKTCLNARPDQPLRMPYIQGVARVPHDFDRVASIEVESEGVLALVAESGVVQKVLCDFEFLSSGKLEDLIE